MNIYELEFEEQKKRNDKILIRHPKIWYLPRIYIEGSEKSPSQYIKSSHGSYGLRLFCFIGCHPKKGLYMSRRRRRKANHDPIDAKDRGIRNDSVTKDINEPVDPVNSEERIEQNEPDQQVEEQIMDELEKKMDEEYMMAGKAVAEMFRTIYLASMKLPYMELLTDYIDVINNKNRLSVVIHHNSIRALVSDAQEPEDDSHDSPDGRGTNLYNSDDEEKEGMLYDGD